MYTERRKSGERTNGEKESERKKLRLLEYALCTDFTSKNVNSRVDLTMF